MTQPNALRTFDLLGEFGWTSDERSLLGPTLAKRIEAPGFWLSAAECVNLSAVPIVLVTGGYQRRGTMTEIQFELPQRVASATELQEMLVRALMPLKTGGKG